MALLKYPNGHIFVTFTLSILVWYLNINRKRLLQKIQKDSKY